MNSFFSLSSSSEPDSKVPVAPKILPTHTVTPVIAKGSSEYKTFLASLTYTVPGMYVASKRTKPGKGKRNSVPRFPSPQVTNRPNAVYNVYKSASFASTQSATAIEVIGAYNFALSQVSDYLSLAAVFDQYRIAMVEITFLPKQNFVTTGNTYDRLATVIDYVDSSTVGFVALTDYPSCQITEDFTKQVRTLIPRVAVAAYSGAFTSFMSEEAPWLDCSSPNIQHYGVKFAFKITTVIAYYDIAVRYHMQFRNSV